MGTAGPIAITPAGSAWRCSTRRPSSRSAARVDGATTVTSWPRVRSPAAIPATCSFTSWGCDHANGVTRQMRTRSRLAPFRPPEGDEERGGRAGADDQRPGDPGARAPEDQHVLGAVGDD